MLNINAHAVQSLQVLRQQDKFVADKQLFYPGAGDESIRETAQTIINKALDFLITTADQSLTEPQFWTAMEFIASQFVGMDSEEMDRALSYIEQIMAIVGIESSQGRLNEWRYRFDPEVLW